MPDNEDRRLIEMCDAAVAAYSATVARMNQHRGYLSMDEYHVLYGEAEAARYLCEEAMLALKAYRNSTL